MGYKACVGYKSGIIGADKFIPHIGDIISNLEIKDQDGKPIVNPWSIAFRCDKTIQWADFKQNERSSSNGLVNNATVVKFPDIPTGAVKFEDNKLYAVDNTNAPTDRYVDFSSIQCVRLSDGVTENLNPLNVLYTYEMYSSDKKAFIVEQGIPHSDGSFEPSTKWNFFRKTHEITDVRWLSVIRGEALIYKYYWSTPPNSQWTYMQLYPSKTYQFNYFQYDINEVHYFPQSVVLKLNDSVDPFYVCIRESEKSTYPTNVYPNFVIEYGKSFTGSSYAGDISYAVNDSVKFSGKTSATIVDQVRVHEAYLRITAGSDKFKLPSYSWGVSEYGDTLKSFPTILSHARHNTDGKTYISNRRLDAGIYYRISVTDKAIKLVTKGDPVISDKDYYTSFTYIGRLDSFNVEDGNNFCVTSGMGETETQLNGYSSYDIDPLRTDYRVFGKKTSNGNTSINVFKSYAGAPYSSHYLSYLAQDTTLSYLGEGEGGFNASMWTDHYHSSPAVVISESDGVRGALNGLLLLFHKSVLDEYNFTLDTEETDQTGSKYYEEYEYCTINAPISVFGKAPMVGNVGIALLKNIKRGA